MAKTEVSYNPNISVYYQADSLTFPSNPIEGDELFVTSTGDNTGDVFGHWIFDGINWFNIGADGIHLRVKATEALAKGDVIKFVGFNAGEQAIEVAKRNDLNVPAIGVIYTASLATGEFGMAVSNGLFKGLDTSAFSGGTVLYPNASGGFTATNPGGYAQQMAYVVRSHAVNGEIMLNVGPVYGLDKRDLYTREYLVANWSIEPSLNTAITGGEVYDYTLNGITRYRFVPTIYNPTADSFYTTFTGGVLSGLITSRG